MDIMRSGEWAGALPLCSQLRNWSLNQSQESGVACPRNQLNNLWLRPIQCLERQPRNNPGYVENDQGYSRANRAKKLDFSAICGAVTGFGTQGRQVRRTKLLMRLNLLKGNTEKEWCKTGTKQTAEERVVSFEWGSCT